MIPTCVGVGILTNGPIYLTGAELFEEAYSGDYYGWGSGSSKYLIWYGKFTLSELKAKKMWGNGNYSAGSGRWFMGFFCKIKSDSSRRTIFYEDLGGNTGSLYEYASESHLSNATFTLVPLMT